MASEILAPYDLSGLTTLYARLDLGAQCVRVSTGGLLTRSAANHILSAIYLSDSAAIRNYLGSVPASTPAGTYRPRVFRRQGILGGELLSDPIVYEAPPIVWSGTAVVGLEAVAAAIADAVWDELLSGHVIAGSAGAGLSASGVDIDDQLDRIEASTGLITSSGVYVLADLANDFTIVRGDSYGTTSGQTRVITKPTGGSWPTLTGSGWVVSFTAIKRTDNAATGTATLTVTAVVTSDTSVRIDLTAAQTTGLAIGTNGWTYELQASNGSLRNTFARGNMSVLEDLKIT